MQSVFSRDSRDGSVSNLLDHETILKYFNFKEKGIATTESQIIHHNDLMITLTFSSNANSKKSWEKFSFKPQD